MYSLHSDFLSQTLFIFYLLTSYPLTVLSGSGGCLVAKLFLTAVTPCPVAHQAPLSMGFPRPKYQSGLPFPSPGDLPNPGIQPGFSALQANSLPIEPPGEPNQYQGEVPILFLSIFRETKLPF